MVKRRGNYFVLYLFELDLSILFFNMEMWKECEEMFTKALNLYILVFGESHPSTAQVLFNFAGYWK